MLPVVVSYGGGVNSTAMLIGMVERGMRPDHILFADTGGELPEVYAYRDGFCRWLLERGFPEIVTVGLDCEYASLEDECLKTNTLPSLAFGWKTCSQKWKRRAIEHHLKAIGLEKWQTAIGFDAGEARRAKDYQNVIYPLRDWVWTRKQCEEAIRNAGLCVPEKSACFFCPARRKPEVIELSKDHPELFARAVTMERNARQSGKLQVIAGLGRHWSWEDLVNADEQQMKMFPDPPDIPCECWD